MRLPAIDARRLMRVLRTEGFEEVRSRGGHAFFRHPDGRTTVVPVHPGEDLDRALLAKIVKHDLGMDRETFLRRL